MRRFLAPMILAAALAGCSSTAGAQRTASVVAVPTTLEATTTTAAPPITEVMPPPEQAAPPTTEAEPPPTVTEPPTTRRPPTPTTAAARPPSTVSAPDPAPSGGSLAACIRHYESTDGLDPNLYQFVPGTWSAAFAAAIDQGLIPADTPRTSASGAERWVQDAAFTAWVNLGYLRSAWAAQRGRCF